MGNFFWHVLIYSFFGYLLEKAFAFAVRSPHPVRRCFLLLPLCPVYGLGMAAVLAAPQSLRSSPVLILWGGAAATAVEYTVHWWYERFLGVRFWDYADQPWNLQGRVCLPFSLVWGVLTACAVRWIEPWVAALCASLPPWLTLCAAAAVLWDGAASARVLLATGDIDTLGFRPFGKDRT